MNLEQMRQRADDVVPVIAKMTETMFDLRDPPSERNRNIAIAVLRGETLNSFGISRERARQITYRLFRRAEMIMNDKFGYPMSTRLTNCIVNQLGLRWTERWNITREHFEQVAAMSDDDLLRIPNFGKRALQELRSIQKELNQC